MSNKISTITFPKWIKEISPFPQKFLRELIKSFVYLKMKEYKRQLQPFENKYKVTFEEFEKKAKFQKKENFKIWDDYLIWKGLYLSYQKWLKRYKEI